LYVYKYKAMNESENVILINDSHHKIKDYIEENIDCAIYNLGYLPGGDKSITTVYDTTIESIKGSLELLNKGGIVAIAIYHGHEEGQKEKDEVLLFLQNLSSKEYGVMLHKYLNRSNIAPLLVIVEKK
jgi:putative rRNA methylase